MLGYALHRSWSTVGRLAGSMPRALSAQHAYELAVGGTERVATAVTGRLQAGSVPTYLTVILVTVVALPGTAVLVGGSWPDQPVYHAPLQLPLALLVTLAALALVWVRRRFTAVLLVGVVGYGVGGLFIVDGAPDLALAQFLVETLSLVAFVFVLRRMPGRFTLERQRARVQVPKAVIAAVAGGMVAGTAVVLSGARQVPPTTSAEFIRLAPEGAGATNVISAIIVDFRALDTVGEITVLFVAAVGVASLVLATPFDRRRRRRRRERRRKPAARGGGRRRGPGGGAGRRGDGAVRRRIHRPESSASGGGARERAQRVTALTGEGGRASAARECDEPAAQHPGRGGDRPAGTGADPWTRHDPVRIVGPPPHGLAAARAAAAPRAGAP